MYMGWEQVHILQEKLRMPSKRTFEYTDINLGLKVEEPTHIAPTENMVKVPKLQSPFEIFLISAKTIQD